MTLSPAVTRIRRATAQNTARIAGILTAAFLHGDLAPWLIPDETERRTVYPHYFAMLAEHAITHGRVDVIGEQACALWYDHDDTTTPVPIDRYEQRLAAITADALPRFQQLDQAMHRHHPRGVPHAYLALLAVIPDRQGHRLGSALLGHRHTDLSRQRTPAYLEATGERNSALYRARGYESLGPYPIGPGGPLLHPMWWSPYPEQCTPGLGNTRPEATPRPREPRATVVSAGPSPGPH